MSVPSASVFALAGPAGGATTVYLPLTGELSMVAKAYGPVKYIPVTPVWNALLVSVVVSLSALGCTTFCVQNRSLNQVVACTPAALFTEAENLPPPVSLKYSPPACQKNVDQYQEMYPRVVEPGTASPYVSALPLPSGSPVVNALAMAATSSQLFGGWRLSLVSQSLRMNNRLAWAEKGTAYTSPLRSLAASHDPGVNWSAPAILLLSIFWMIPWLLKLPSCAASLTTTSGRLCAVAAAVSLVSKSVSVKNGSISIVLVRSGGSHQIGDLGARGHPQLVQDARHVHGRGLRRDVQPPGQLGDRK